MNLALSKIRMDGGTQPRVALDFETVGEYVDAMEAGVKFPPIDVFYDGSDYWLADGFHRTRAARDAGLKDFNVTVHQGTVQDAQWFSLGANKGHGLRRTNQDKQRAIKAALEHPKSAKLSDHKIALHVGVDVKTVGNWRQKLSMEVPQIKSRTVTRNGTTYEQSVTNIGKRVAAVASVAQVDLTPDPLRPQPPVITKPDDRFDAECARDVVRSARQILDCQITSRDLAKRLAGTDIELLEKLHEFVGEIVREGRKRVA